MLRVLFSEAEGAAWLLTEDELLKRVDELMQGRFAGVPAGRVSVEAVDELGRVQWRAYYPSAGGLAILARQIREGRVASSRRRRMSRA